MNKLSLHIEHETTGLLTMTIGNDYDHFHGDAKVSALG